MRSFPLLVVLLSALAACSPAAKPIEPPGAGAVPRLLPPPPMHDLDTPDAIYRTALALQLQPGWAGFLEDCRLRLPATHALNRMALAATAKLAIDAAGKVVDIHLASSGNVDFDRAVRQVIEDAAPLPRPPRALWSDDDHVHVRWLFARDRRQAGPATASIESFELPVRRVVSRFVGTGELARAAQRIRRAPADSDRDAATYELMTAVLREALASTDATVRRAAVDAIGRTGVRELAPAVRDLLTSTSDTELRIAAFDANTRLGDRATVSIVLDQLRTDVHHDRRLAVAEIQLLVAMGAAGEAATIVRDAVDQTRPSPGSGTPNLIALYALSHVTVPELTTRLVAWQRTGDARLRAAVCSAFVHAPAADAWAAIGRGIRDRDASVRASCLDAAAARGQLPADGRKLSARIRELVRDRDALVRARALMALARLAPDALPAAADDRAPEVRAAYATALATAATGDADAGLRDMLDDRDADVRAAAWTGWLDLPPGPASHGERAARAIVAAGDPAPLVRRASLSALDDDALLTRLATADDAPEVRTAAIVALARRRGRATITAELLERLAAAAPGSAERVRTALAWLLAR